MSSFSPPPLWCQWYSSAITAFEHKQFHQALTAFDEATQLSKTDISVLPSRMEVFDRLRVLDDAFDEGRKVDSTVSFADLDSSSELQESRLFAVLCRLPESIQANLLSRSSTKPDTSLMDIISRAKPILRICLSQRNFIDQLPVEILTSIAHHVVTNTPPQEWEGRDSQRALPLIAVSRRWRRTLLEEKTLWGSLTFRRNEGVRKLDAFLEKGALRDLDLTLGDDVLRPLLKRVKGMGRNLQGLKFSLSSRGKTSVADYWSALFDTSDPTPPPLRLLDIYTSGTFAPIEVPSYVAPNIRTLRIDTTSFIFPTANFPLLHTLRLSVATLRIVSSPSPIFNNTVHLSLPTLHHLSIKQRAPQTYASLRFDLPNLQTLDLAETTLSYVPFLFPPSSSSTLPTLNNASNLTTLAISRVTSAEETTFIAHLSLLPRLKVLRVGSGFDSDALARALTRQENGVFVLCPLLESLDMSYASTSEAAVRALMEARRGRGLEEVRPGWGVREGLAYEFELKDGHLINRLKD